MDEQLIDRTAEDAVLGSCFLGGYSELIRAMEILTTTDFYQERDRMVFEALIDLQKKGRPIDDVTIVFDALGGKVALRDLAAICNTVTNYNNTEYYAQIVKSKSMARQKVAKCREEVERLLSGDDPGEIISRSMQNDVSILSSEQKTEVRHIKDTYFDFLDELDRRRECKGLIGISSGFSDIDQLLGGFRDGSMYIIGARPKMGKTTFAIDIALNVALEQKIPVYFKSLEMTTSQINEKVANRITGIDSDKLQNARLLNDNEHKVLANAGEKLYGSELYIDEKNCKASQFGISLRKWKLDHPKGLVITDYLQRFKPESSKKSEYEQVTDTSNILCDLAKEIGFPIVVLSQLSREVEKRADKVPMAADLRGSGALEQDAAAAMLMYRDDYYNPEKYEVLDPSLVNVIIPLNRYGPSGRVDFQFFKAKSKFVQVKQKGVNQ